MAVSKVAFVFGGWQLAGVARIACFLVQPGAAKRFEELSLVGPSWWFSTCLDNFLKLQLKPILKR